MKVYTQDGDELDLIRHFRNGEATYAESFIPAGDGWLAVLRLGDGPGIFTERVVAWEQRVILTESGRGQVGEYRELVPVLWEGCMLAGYEDILGVVHEKDMTAEKLAELERAGAESWAQEQERLRKAQEHPK